MNKKSEEKNARKFFFKNTRIRYPKNVGKNRLKKVRKHVFYKQINIVTKKWGEKTRENFFSRNTRISQGKNDGKKSSGKVRKHVFYKQTNIVTKNRGKKREGKIFKKKRIGYQKNVRKKSSQKSAKKCFLINT